MAKQRTIKAPVTVSGVGLHTGAKVSLTFKPAPENYWYKFQRVDMPDKPIIDADADYVISTDHGTTLEKNGARVHTTEHVLAALVGMEIDNCLIEVTGPEMPIMNGSSMPFIEALEKAGIVEQNAERIYFELTSILSYEDNVKHVEMLAVPQEEFRLTVMVDYNSEVLGTQHAHIYKVGEFKEEIAMCRTFVFLHELEMLLKHNLIKGGDLDNAIVLVDKPVPDEDLAHLRKVFNKPDVEIKGRGVLNNTQLHYYNEPARHKLLDIVGDLALIGMPVKAHILAARPGHAGNVSFAKIFKERIKKDNAEKEKAKAEARRVTEIPKYDVNKVLLDINDIMKLLPHRDPFLLIDKILELSPTHVVGVKNVSMNEDYFRGHFPGNPVMPGVLLVEAMAQVGGVLVLKTVPDPENYLTYFLKIENAKFKNKVVPGDTVIFVLHLLEPIRRGLCRMRGTAYVNEKAVMEADMLAQIIKVKSTPSASAVPVNPN
ncbi:MAG: bifunctional UDP-3-O-[3-hydroxymyristoyl] N-acetylglucosamine deacetylase/3-hydroxyacyl-ACP dehydratase [Bacteroidetes bacterium]|nr:MAG: bifunctional UDP-3-O-[3-hydroxymyristoyl] N-acetylglucosamine deacetylase/3-hydroxyacyl-ACP dehydratase [Bacteroidota bacterium]